MTTSTGQRTRTHPCEPLIRRVKRGCFQCRIWLAGTRLFPAGVSVNCGTYRTEELAIRVRDRILERLEIELTPSGNLPPGWQFGLTPLSI
jgi:hypothetical protein